MTPTIAKYLIFIGLALVLLGFAFFFFNDKFQWLGKLPGDIHVKKDNFSFHFPVVTMLLISLLINLVIWIFKKIAS